MQKSMAKKRDPIPSHAKCVFKGKIFEVWQWEQKLYDSSTKTFERLKRPDTVQVVTVVGDKILILEETQPDKSTPFLTLPGGRVDPGEDPLTAAKRELHEETGYSAQDWSLWLAHDPVGKIEWTIYTYIARDSKEDAEPHLDGGERVTAQLVTFDEFLALSNDPRFYDPSLTHEFVIAHYDPAYKETLRKLILG